MDKIAVLIPCYNEALTIHKVVSDFRRVLPEAVVYVYDNNSTDGTAEIAEKAGAVVRYEHQQGKGNVIRRMFAEVDAQCYVMADGDDTYPADCAGELVDKVLTGGADMVVGDRLSSTYFSENKRPFHNLGNTMVRKAINVLFNLPALLFPIALKPDYKMMEPYGGRKDTIASHSSDQGALAISVSMLVILMVYTGCSAAAAALPQHFSGIAESYDMMSTGALMVSACMISNTAGKILLGTLIDRIGTKLSVSLYAALIVCGALLIVFSRNSAVLIAAAAMYGLCYSMGTVSTAMLTREMFGPAKYSRVYPKLAMTTTISNAVFTTVVGMLYDMSGTYSTVILFLAALVILAFCMLQLAYAQKAKTAEQY